MSTTHDELMLIDGALVDTDSGARFDEVKPAIVEILGQVADASLVESRGG